MKIIVFWQKAAARGLFSSKWLQQRGFFRGAQRAFPWEMQKLSIFPY